MGIFGWASKPAESWVSKVERTEPCLGLEGAEEATSGETRREWWHEDTGRAMLGAEGVGGCCLQGGKRSQRQRNGPVTRPKM